MASSRGQLILVAALGIAITFVSLALIVNTVIFTENLATRETIDGDRPVAFERTVEESAATLMGLVNRDNRTQSNDYSSIVSAYKYDVETMSHGNRLLGASSGSLRSASVTSVQNGTQIVQEETAEMHDDQGNSTWRLATNVHDTRRFVLNVTEITNPPFVLNVTDGSDTWEMQVTDSGDFEIRTYVNGTHTGVTCTDPGDSVRIDVSSGVINGTPCSSFQFGRDVSPPYTITFEHSTNTTGSYHLIVDRQVGEIDSTLDQNYETDGSGPTLYTALYKATIDVTVRRPDLYYTANVTVEPEEPPGT
ncbi:MAG: hypothetical protein ABEJ58_06370 [Halodesulfurarchaeum sp.]